MVTLEWLAGFFDGEGCVGLHVDRRRGKEPYAFNPRLMLGQKDRRILEAVVERFGGRLYGPNNTQGSVVEWWGEGAVNLARMLLPYSNCKRKQLYILLKAAEKPTRERKQFHAALKAEKKNVKVA